MTATFAPITTTTCRNCLHSEYRKRDPLPAEFRVWCPTWVSADKGPIDLCYECYKVFSPGINPHAADGHFFIGDLADAAFRTVEAFIPRADPRYTNAKGMLENGAHVRGPKHIHIFSSSTFIVDGKVWVASYQLLARLGDYADVKARMPKLFGG